MATHDNADLEIRLRDLAHRVATLEGQVFGPRAASRIAGPAEEISTPSAIADPLDVADLPEPDAPEPRRRLHLPARAKADPTPFDIERFIGGKTFAVLGALAVVVAAALFLKLAYDQGWLGRLPDGWKCVCAALFGFGLLGAGEFALRRWGRYASMGLTAAGLGVVYASAFAAYGMYHLVPAPTAFAMMASVIALGFGLSARARRVPVAVLTTLAGYAIPFMLNDASSVEYVFPAHVLAMLAIALGLSAKLGHSFRVVRALAWWCTMLLGTVWALAKHDAHPELTVAFLAGFWAMTHAELLWSCRRDDRAEGVDKTFNFDEFNARPLQTAMRPLVRPMLASFSQTSWTALLGAVTISHGLNGATWIAPAALFVATALLWLAFAGSLRVLRDTPHTRLETFGASLAAQAGGLLIITGALALDGLTESLAGLALGVSACFAAAWLGLRPVRIYGVVALLLATVRILVVDFGDVMGLQLGAPLAAWLTVEVGPVLLTRWTLVAVIGAFAWLAAGLLVRPTRSDNAEPHDAPANARVWFACAAAGLILLGFVSADATPLGVFWPWLACAFAFPFVLRVYDRVGAGALGLTAASLAGCAWVCAWPPMSWDSIDAAPLLHPAFLASLALLAGLLTVRFSAPKGLGESPTAVLRDVASALGVLLAFVASSAEVARVAAVYVDGAAKYASLTVWWALFATAMIVLGFVRCAPIVRHVGLALLCVAAGKAVVYDLAEVEPAWRIASFLGVGLFMLGVATGYTRIARMARTQRASTE